MSLVVGQRYSDGIRLVGETRVTESEWHDTARIAPRTQYLDGALKIVVLHPALCIGYAGPVAPAQGAIRDVAAISTTDFAPAEVHALLSSASRRGPDFIVALLKPELRLSRICDGTIEEGLDRTHVGSSRAYSRFQEALERRGGPGTSARGFGGLTRVMVEVVESGVDSTVGDLVIEARCDEAGFRYTGWGIISTGGFDPNVAPEEDNPETWGSASAGAYYATYLYPRDPGVGALGVYFYQARLGALFYPAVAERALAYPAVSHQEFVELVRREHGVVLVGSRVEAYAGRNFVLQA